MRPQSIPAEPLRALAPCPFALIPSPSQHRISFCASAQFDCRPCQPCIGVRLALRSGRIRAPSFERWHTRHRRGCASTHQLTSVRLLRASTTPNCGTDLHAATRASTRSHPSVVYPKRLHDSAFVHGHRQCDVDRTVAWTDNAKVDLHCVCSNLPISKRGSFGHSSFDVQTDDLCCSVRQTLPG